MLQTELLQSKRDRANGCADTIKGISKKRVDRFAVQEPIYKCRNRRGVEETRFTAIRSTYILLSHFVIHLSPESSATADTVTRTCIGPVYEHPSKRSSYTKYNFSFRLPPPLWSSGQSSCLQTNRFRVRLPALPHFLISSGSGTGSTQPHEDK
jgi:hypothetical protein